MHNIEFIFKRSADGRECKRIMETLHRFTRDIIVERFESYKNKIDDNEEKKSSDHKGRMAFFDLLVNSSTEEHGRLTVADIQEEVTIRIQKKFKVLKKKNIKKK